MLYGEAEDLGYLLQDLQHFQCWDVWVGNEMS